MRLSLKDKLSYGVGAVCDNTMYMLAGTYLLLFLTTVAGVSPAIAGTISAIGSIWEALCAPVVGFKSDNAVTRFGKRKPFMLAAVIPVIVITILIKSCQPFKIHMLQNGSCFRNFPHFFSLRHGSQEFCELIP